MYVKLLLKEKDGPGVSQGIRRAEEGRFHGLGDSEVWRKSKSQQPEAEWGQNSISGIKNPASASRDRHRPAGIPSRRAAPSGLEVQLSRPGAGARVGAAPQLCPRITFAHGAPEFQAVSLAPAALWWPLSV